MNCCNNVITISTISVASGIMTLTSTQTMDLIDGTKFTLVIPERLIPVLTTINAIEIGIGGTGYELFDRCVGNYVYSDQLRFIETSCKGNKVLRIVYGDAPEHFKVISQCLPKSEAY